MEFVFSFSFVLSNPDFYGKLHKNFFRIFSFSSPIFIRKLHGKAGRTYTDTESNQSSTDNQDRLSVKSLDAALESTPVQTDNRDKKLYLKSLERSLRTGRRIQDEEDNNDENGSRANPLKFIRHCVNKHIRRKTNDTQETTDL